jgi:hypothetical protein
MARDEAYREAEQRIEAARQAGATELDLNFMELTEVPEAIAALTQLQRLGLSDNPLNLDLAAAYEQGIEAVMQLRAKAEGEVTLNEAKLILVEEY